MDSHTLVQALIYLGSAALIVPIAVRLGLGSVLGYLIAGFTENWWLTLLCSLVILTGVLLEIRKREMCGR